MKKALIVATLGGFIGFEKNNIKLLKQKGFEVYIACNTSGFEKYLKQFKVNIIDIPFSRQPFSKNNYFAYKKLKNIINTTKFELIHCHTPTGSVIARLAAKKARKKMGTKVIYTAHGFHFFKGAPIKNWLIYYPIERTCSRFTDIIITINNEDYKFAKEKMKSKEVYYISGVGLDIKSINDCKITRQEKRIELGLKDEDFIILSVGELNKNKNHKLIINALSTLNIKNLHFVIAGTGRLKQYYELLIKQLNLEENVHLLGYRTDIIEIYKIADVFCFPSFREGLSVSLMEAMANGLPCIVSNIRGNVDLIEDDIGGYLIDPMDVKSFNNTLIKLLYDNEKSINMGLYNSEKIKQFDLSIVEPIISKIYDNCFD